MVPIPGTRQVKYLEGGCRRLEPAAPPEELSALEAIAPKGVAMGMRYPGSLMRLLGG